MCPAQAMRPARKWIGLQADLWEGSEHGSQAAATTLRKMKETQPHSRRPARRHCGLMAEITMACAGSLLVDLWCPSVNEARPKGLSQGFQCAPLADRRGEVGPDPWFCTAGNLRPAHRLSRSANTMRSQKQNTRWKLSVTPEAYISHIS